jgi:tetratricopeptide (TPR) repeat protein
MRLIPPSNKIKLRRPTGARLARLAFFQGQFSQGLDPILRCLRLSPRDPLASFFVSLVALAHYHLCNYPEAMRWSERALQRRRTYSVLRTAAAT